MEFCDDCDNLLYMKDNEGKLVKYCKHCSFSKELDPRTAGAFKVTQTMYSEDDLLYKQHQNKYLRFDPTLPRVQDPNIHCPSQECTGPKDAPRVLYVKYHPVHMKYFYCCEYCGYTWRLDEQKMM
jgi:DNA-directed RNA polymerase subunit M/transcription elongation factor TFIIS